MLICDKSDRFSSRPNIECSATRSDQQQTLNLIGVKMHNISKQQEVIAANKQQHRTGEDCEQRGGGRRRRSRRKSNCSMLIDATRGASKMFPISNLKSTTLTSHRSHQTTTASCLLIIVCTLFLVQQNYSIVSCKQQQPNHPTTPSNAATMSQQEAIKWSFGGWAPLNGMLVQTNSSTGEPQFVGISRQQQQQQQVSSGTTPMPTPMRQTQAGGGLNQTTIPTRQQLNNRQQHQNESLNESASNSHEKVQFASPVNSAGQHAHRLQSGPAYALPMHSNQNEHHQHHNQQQQYSPAAPPPIVREHLLPAAAAPAPSQFHHQSSQQQPPRPRAPPPSEHMQTIYHPAQQPPPPQQRHPMPGHQARPHQLHHPGPHHPLATMHSNQLRAPPQMIRMPPFPNEHRMRQMEQHHRQQMMQHHQQMMMQHHHHQYPHPHQQQQQHQQQQHHLPRPAPPMHYQHHPHRPGPPMMQHHQQQQQQQRHPQVGSFKLIEGEHPILFNAPVQENGIPMMELSGNGQLRPAQPADHRNVSSEYHKSQSQVAMNSIEKENANYQKAMGQAEHQPSHKPSNNIQDIKQRQQQQQQHPPQPPHSAPRTADYQSTKSTQNYANNFNQSSKSPYLTIPVAVETEGDKVLTPDDLNEIEKHVINVLPNLKTADKIVKLADAHLQQQLSSGVTPPMQPISSSTTSHQQQQQSSIGPEQLHQMNYNEHQKTMQQLEVDLKAMQQQHQRGQHHQTASTSAQSTPAHNNNPTTASHQQQQQPINQATTTSAHHQEAPMIVDDPATIGQHLSEHQYFVAAGPAQELGPVDSDQAGEYNLIKNDLLETIQYEPTRAANSNGASQSVASYGRQQQQTASTPPMPYTAGQAQSDQYDDEAARRRPAVTSGRQTNGPSVTRYFHQGRPSQQAQQQAHDAESMSYNSPPSQSNRQQHHHQRNNNNDHLKRLRAQQQGHAFAPQRQPQSTTPKAATTILGGRKVSEVMRNLIHTTPVPMTSPVHMNSVEPEKVDAIQLIAGQANDKQPMVVEAHQLVSHTPDGGIDYQSGGGGGGSSNSNNQLVTQQQQQQLVSYNQSQQATGEQQQPQPYVQSNPNEDNQNAIIEYVAINDQALSNALAQQQQHNQQGSTPAQQQAYELASTPEVQPVYVSEQQAAQLVEQQQQQQHSSGAPFVYDYTMTTQRDQQAHSPTNEHQQQQVTTPGYATTSNGERQQQSHEPVTILAIQQQEPTDPNQQQAWAPAMASEHQQQQQLEQLSGHAMNAMQQMDMPATAGYNFFPAGNQQQQQTSQAQSQEATTSLPIGYQTDFEQHQPQTKGGGWRTKAGGSQPNPDAQYDGQIARDAEGQSQIDQHQAVSDQQALDEHQQQHQTPDSQSDTYNQQQQQTADLVRLEQPSSLRPNNEQPNYEVATPDQYQPDAGHQQTASTASGDDQQQQDGAGYLSTNSFVGGARLNYSPAPSHGLNDQRPRTGGNNFGSKTAASHQNAAGFSYAKLDRDRQQNHLEQHKAQLAELIGNGNAANQQQQQQLYVTTTPMSLTTLAADIEQQQQQQEVAQQPEQQQHQNEQEQQARQQAQAQEVVQIPSQQQGTEQQANQQQQQQQADYVVEQVPSHPSVQSSPESLLVNESPMQVPILDQQSLIQDSNQESTNEQISDDDAAKQRQQPAGVYQVYQAYYAPKDHKPLPGYVRLSLEEFNELFRDAEIQYVDRNLNGLAQNLINNDQQQQQQQQQQMQPSTAADNYQQVPSEQQQQQSQPQQQLSYEQAASLVDNLKASASEMQQSIVVDQRSISDRRSSKSPGEDTTATAQPSSTPKMSPDENSKSLAQLAESGKTKLGQAVKKIISIRNSRHLAKQIKASKLVMKRVKSTISTTSTSTTKPSPSTSTTTTKPVPLKASDKTNQAAPPKKSKPIVRGNGKKGGQPSSPHKSAKEQKSTATKIIEPNGTQRTS